MVRFEKLIWENLFNIKAFGRQRVLGSPQKWFKRNDLDDINVAQAYLFETGIRATIFRWFEPILAYLFWKWPRDIALQRGLAMEDFFLHTDREQRREFLFEHINRESCHPYQHLFFRKRRARYYKVERALKGFYAPEHVRKEAENRLACDTAELMEEWSNHVYINYFSDMTPATRYTAMHRLIPLEIFNLYGLFKTDAWDRYFLNEVEFDEYTTEDDAYANVAFRKYNLDTEEGKRGFESEVNRFIDLYPGSIVKEGEQFNFREFYARDAIARGKDVSRLDPQYVEEIENKMESEALEITSQSSIEKKVGKSTVGTEFPARLKSKNRKVLM